MNVSDFGSAAFYENPYPLYEKLRSEGALVGLLPGLWITGHHRVAEIMLREKHVGKDFMAFIRSRYGEAAEEGAAFQLFNQSLLMMNPPEHTALKALWARAFSARHTQDFFKLARQTTHSLIDGFYGDGQVDLVAQYNNKVPLVVICNLLGLTDAQTDFFSRELWHLTTALTRSLELSGFSELDVIKADDAALKLRDFFLERLYERRKKSGADLISQLLALEESGWCMSDEQMIANIIFLFAAGHETSGNMIGNALVSLFKHPDILRRVRDDKTLLPACILESLRYDSSVHVAAREVIEDFDFEGTSLHKGDTIVVSLGSANHDPLKFKDPELFVLDRPGLEVRDLASFGGGAHYCVGARLALIEIETALLSLFERMPDIEIVDMEHLNWHQSTTIRGVDSLTARWSIQ